MNDAKDDGEIEVFRRILPSRWNSASVNSLTIGPKLTKELIQLECQCLQIAGIFLFFPSVRPLSSHLQGCILHQGCIIMPCGLFLPDVETWLAGIEDRVIEVEANEACQALFETSAQAEPAVCKSHGCECAQGWPVMLGPRPANEVECAIGVIARFAQDPHAFDGPDLTVGTQILTQFRRHLGRQTVGIEELATADAAELQAEFREIVKCSDYPGFQIFVNGRHKTHGVHHDGGIAEPVEEIIRLAAGKIGGGTGKNRPWHGPDGLPEPIPPLYERSRRNGLFDLLHTLRAEAISPFFQ